jgi:hypothetical protein
MIAMRERERWLLSSESMSDNEFNFRFSVLNVGLGKRGSMAQRNKKNMNPSFACMLN